MLKKCLSVLLSFVLLFSIISVLLVSVSAQETEVAEIGGDDYPYANYGMSGYDPWLFVYRNCTSFVAWRLNSRNGVDFNNWYGGIEWKGAYNWGNAARSLGITVDDTPAVGSVAWQSSGHVAWVAEVGDNGTVFIEEYNWNGDGKYHSRWMNNSSYSGFIHIKDIGGGGSSVHYHDGSVTNVTSNNATISTWVRNTGEIYQMGFYLSSNGSQFNKIYTNFSTVEWTDFHLSYDLSERYGLLSPGQTYYYKFFVLKSDGEYCSEILTFRTSGDTIISFDTYDIPGVGDDSARTRAWMSNEQAKQISEIGIICDKEMNVYNKTPVTNNVNWTRAYLNYELRDYVGCLVPDTSYYVRYYAVVNGITYYSDYFMFTTASATYAYMDVNFWVDGKSAVSIDDIGYIQVYINGELQKYKGEESYTDFSRNVYAGKPYEIKVFITNPDYHFNKVDTYSSGHSYSGLTGTTNPDGTYVRLAIVKDTGGTKDLTNGVYKIVSSKDSNYRIDIEGSAYPANNEDNIFLWQTDNETPDYDLFTLTNLGNGYYSIKQKGTNMAFDVYAGSANRYENVQVYEGNNSNAQQWKICYNSSIGAYTLQAKCSGLYLTVEDGVMAAGTNINQNIKDDSTPKSQGWIFIPQEIFCYLGDADGDGEISAIDVAQIMRAVAHISTGIDDDVLMNADVDGNGELEIIDATYVQRYLAKLDTPYAIGEAI